MCVCIFPFSVKLWRRVPLRVICGMRSESMTRFFLDFFLLALNLTKIIIIELTKSRTSKQEKPGNEAKLEPHLRRAVKLRSSLFVRVLENQTRPGYQRSSRNYRKFDSDSGWFDFRGALMEERSGKWCIRYAQSTNEKFALN